VSLGSPLVLLALLAIPVLGAWYAGQQRRRARASAAFNAPALSASVTPRRPGWRRHVPMLVIVIALAVLVVAAARPRVTQVVPVDSAAIMLANDISSSMTSTDVKPSRLVAAKLASDRLLGEVPASVQVGQLEFARRPTLLQSPTPDRTLTRAAIESLHPGGGGTAIGDAIQTAMQSLMAVRQNGKRPPGAIILLSDGGSNFGVSPVAAAARARGDHIPVYTIALGTSHGTITIKRRGRTVIAPVPVSPQALAQIAAASGGRAFTAADATEVRSIYDHLAKQLGHRKVKREITADVVGGGLALLLIGSALSVFWFDRLA
jgi:Ca-activated chloride channel homolog